jgi:hypothetical protein
LIGRGWEVDLVVTEYIRKESKKEKKKREFNFS